MVTETPAFLSARPTESAFREWGSAGAGPGQFELPHSIVIDENGIIYVADRENGRIQRCDLDGKYLASSQTWAARIR
jgi:sugar lactone lactonase YvrE